MKDLFPQMSKRIYLQIVFRMLKFAKRIVTVSENTKSDLIREFGFKENKIQKIYNGVDTTLFYSRTSEEIAKFKNKYSLPEKFLLAVGIGKEHKNYKFIINSLNKFWTNRELQIPLVIAGTNGKLPDFLEDVALIAGKNIILAPKFPYQELSLLYQSAEFLIFPSLYEGFGFPLIEAQASSCPVLSSNVSVMPEILENSAEYFSPTDELSFLACITNALGNNFPRKKYIELGLKNCKRFSWEKAAMETVELYRKEYLTRRRGDRGG
jgi:glycosyltransferase involved in cell wall biosynthesis